MRGQAFGKRKKGEIMTDDKRFAVLIDAENIAHKYVKIILDEISNDGEATYKRIYGDWTKSSMNPWKKVLLEHSIMPIQQYEYTTGKNASDSAMIIDAMDILYSGNVEGFCLVTSDSDFTRLAARLRESGMLVVGMGERKTPKAFISACNKFKYLDILAVHAGTEDSGEAETDVPKGAGAKSGKPDKTAGKAEKAEKADKTEKAALDAKTVKNGKPAQESKNGSAEMTSLETIREAVATIVAENADEDEWVFVGDLGNRLLKRYPDFDVRNYGYKKLTPFIKSLNLFDVKSEPGANANNKLVYVRERDGAEAGDE